jgi:hypothetical protein
MNSTTPVPREAWLEILLKLLDGPFLLAVVVIVFLCLFRKQLMGLLGRGDIQVSWGDGRSIRLRDLAEKLDEELDPLRDDVEALKQATPAATPSAQPIHEPEIAEPTSNPREHALRVMKEALANPKYRWRAVERLATLAYLPEPEAAELLRSDPDVVFGIGKSRRPIARLKHR